MIRGTYCDDYFRNLIRIDREKAQAFGRYWTEREDNSKAREDRERKQATDRRNARNRAERKLRRALAS